MAGTITFTETRRLPNLVANMAEMRAHTHVILRNSAFATPLSILPICAFAKKIGCKVHFDESNNRSSICSYLKTIEFPEGRESVQFSRNRSYLPITRVDFPTSPVTLNAAADQYISLILQDFDSKTRDDVQESLQYAFGEMTTNVLEHAEAEHYWLFAQKYPQKREMEFCIIDDGVGITRRFLNANIVVARDSEAVALAMKGKSAKHVESDLPGDRGHGLRSTKSLLTGPDFNGAFLLLSGGGVYLKIKDSPVQLGDFPESWPGVMIWARIKIPETKIDLSRYVNN